MNPLFCPPHPCCFSACVFLCRSGGFQLRSQLDPLRATSRPPTSPSCGGGGGASRERAVTAPKQPPWQDQTWQSPCSQPGTREGKLAGGRRPSWRRWGVPRQQLRLQQPPARVRSDGARVGATGLGRQPDGAGSGLAPRPRSMALSPRTLWTQAWGFPGPGSRLPGKIPAPFPAPQPCPAERGRGFPESARRPPSRHWTESAHVGAALPLRQRGKPQRARLGGAAPAHCASRPRHPAPW